MLHNNNLQIDHPDALLLGKLEMAKLATWRLQRILIICTRQRETKISNGGKYWCTEINSRSSLDLSISNTGFVCHHLLLEGHKKFTNKLLCYWTQSSNANIRSRDKKISDEITA